MSRPYSFEPLGAWVARGRFDGVTFGELVGRVRASFGVTVAGWNGAESPEEIFNEPIVAFGAKSWPLFVEFGNGFRVKVGSILEEKGGVE